MPYDIFRVETLVMTLIVTDRLKKALDEKGFIGWQYWPVNGPHPYPPI